MARSVGLRDRARLVVLVVACSVAAGCSLLYPQSDNLGQPLASYATGHATMTIGGDTIELDQIAPGPHLIADLGAEVYWFNDQGWGLRLSGGDTAGSPFAMPAMVSIDRIQTAYWTAMDDGGQCRVTLTELDAEGLHGSATCTALRWADVLRGGFGGFGDGSGSPYVDGQPPFDAVVEFEAQPSPPQT